MTNELDSNRVIVTTFTGEEIEIFTGTPHTCESIAEKIFGRIGQKYTAVRWEEFTGGTWCVRSEFEF
jgi:hypothetical protein